MLRYYLTTSLFTTENSWHHVPAVHWHNGCYKYVQSLVDGRRWSVYSLSVIWVQTTNYIYNHSTSCLQFPVRSNLTFVNTSGTNWKTKSMWHLQVRWIKVKELCVSTPSYNHPSGRSGMRIELFLANLNRLSIFEDEGKNQQRGRNYWGDSKVTEGHGLNSCTQTNCSLLEYY